MSIREKINRLKDAKNWVLNNQISGLIDENKLKELFSDVLDLLNPKKTNQDNPIQYTKAKQNSFVSFE